MMEIVDPEDPVLLRLHAKRLISRDIDQLLGICEFALLDGHIDQGEAESILAWLKNHRACLDTWPANVLYDRLYEMLNDGILDSDEQRDLLGIVLGISRPRSGNDLAIATTLPLDAPAPPIIFEARSFCFTGVFDFGTRSLCQAAVEARGATAAGGVTKKLNYLVIGNIGSEVWKHSSFGNKIAKAVEYRDNGLPLAIISENHWAAHIR